MQWGKAVLARVLVIPDVSASMKDVQVEDTFIDSRLLWAPCAHWRLLKCLSPDRVFLATVRDVVCANMLSPSRGCVARFVPRYPIQLFPVGSPEQCSKKLAAGVVIDRKEPTAR